MGYRAIRYLVLAGLLASCSLFGNDGAEPSTKGEQTAGSPAKAAEPTSAATPTIVVATEALETTATPITSTEQPTEAGSNILNWMMADAAIRSDTPPTAIRFQSLGSVKWPSAGLGCPAPGKSYAQVVTPGLRVTLSVRGEEYVYHADEQDNFVLCVNGQPQAPVANFAEESD